MEETILYPSPNWFLPSILGASADGWLVYGGPGKTLVILEPLSSDFDGTFESNHRYKTHVVNRSHKERVVSVDISSEWPEKRHFVTGSSDGSVKEWALAQVENKWTIKNTLSHEAHANEKEEVVGAGYSMGTHVISVGNFSNLVMWELNTNVVKTNSSLMKNFKATCMSCSPHMALVVAVGTKQGVVFVLNLKGNSSVLYKVRGQDDEVSQVSWCPQYEVLLKRSLKEVVKKSFVSQRLERIQNEPEPADLEVSGVEKNLPDDSFEEPTVVQEDDMFDIYKDHEANEFGHKKYEPEDIVVKKKDDSEKDDFLVECERLKAQILKNKNADDESIETLVEAMDKACVGETSDSRSTEGEAKAIAGGASLVPSGSLSTPLDASAHVHKHLLASIGKQGSLRIWSKTGKMVASCVVVGNVKNKQSQQIYKAPSNASICWYKPETLLIADGKTQVLECNPLMIDSRNKLEWRVVHSIHRRSLYCVTSGGDSVWSAAQDRYLVKYDEATRTTLAKFGTCGGFVYNVTPCPYDAGKLAVAVGDGSVRIWETQTTGEDDTKLTLGEVICYWQNVQGKILQCAWHPTKENLLAFSTAESRVGLIDTSGKMERPARVLQPALSGGVYSVAWGDKMELFAVGGGEMVMYQANKPDEAPVPIHIEIEGQKWEPSVVNYSQRGFLVGSVVGGVAMFTGPSGRALAAKFVFTKKIHAIEWHPQQTSSSDEESEYKNLLAVTAHDYTSAIVILQYEDKEGGGKQFSQLKTLVGHTSTALQLYWNPHRDGQLLSTSQDTTVRVWDAIHGVCISVFPGHSCGTLGAAWCAHPQLADKIASGGGDFCLRLWDINDYPAEDYKEVKREPRKRKKYGPKKKTPWRVVDAEKESDDEGKEAKVEKQEEEKQEDQHQLSEEEVEPAVEIVKSKTTSYRSQFIRYLMPITTRQVVKENMLGPRLMLQKYFEKNKEIKNILDIMKEENTSVYGLDFLKLFGTINDVNEVLDMECKSHLALKTYDAYIMLMIFRGHIDTVIKFANEHDMLDSFLLSIAPCVSFKYWKDVMQLYVAQIDRLAAQKQDSKLYENGKTYGGVHFRKAAALLSIHDVKGAVDLLVEGKLFKEAYILCRCRHMDSIADESLLKWANETRLSGNLIMGAILYIALGKVSDAAHILRRSTQPETLNLGAELAKSVGLNIFADYIETKSKSVEKVAIAEDQTEDLEELPTRIQVHMKESGAQNGELKIEQDINELVENGNDSNTDSETIPKSDE